MNILQNIKILVLIGGVAKHNIVIGLYTYDEIKNKYTFVKYSLYNKLNNMYYVCE